ncbi:hypothetical protein C8J57DRAFT_1594762 [Mycena rebaudengoi]|nr:hypothetical protein C8J57DRAFT_1594762 [Mycena rebaudengoi]
MFSCIAVVRTCTSCLARMSGISCWTSPPQSQTSRPSSPSAAPCTTSRATAPSTRGASRPLPLCAPCTYASAPSPSSPATRRFARTTYLQLLDYSLSAFDAASWASLQSLPSLTHLALKAYVAVPARALHELLRESAHLRALVVICRADADTADWGAKYPTHDVRFVVAVVGDWVAGAWGHADFWARADDVIRLRRQ